VQYSETRQQADDLAAEAMRRMAKADMPANPHNFTIWYVYLSGRDPGFNEMLDHLLNSGQPIGEKRSARLYARCIAFEDGGEMSSRDAALQDAGARLEQTVDAVLGKLRDAGADTARYGADLSGLGGKLKAATGEQVHHVVAGLLDRTREMTERNRAVERSLAASNAEIADLRDRIAIVSNEALTDALTGLRNRKAFDEALVANSVQAAGDGEPLALLMLDIDRFKKFNDRYGHLLGDEVIRLVGTCLTDCTKGRDIACRYGGEEFAVILPATDRSGAATVAEQIRRMVAGRKITRKRTSETLGAVTLSIGVAQWHPSETMEEWVQRADEALYAAKEGGRNQVRQASDASPVALLASRTRQA
jgi:diguanylate cyclase